MQQDMLTYDEWLKKNPEAAGEKYDCLICKGSGHLEPLGDFGPGDKCDLCGGTGKVSIAPLIYVRELRKAQKGLTRQ